MERTFKRRVMHAFIYIYNHIGHESKCSSSTPLFRTTAVFRKCDRFHATRPDPTLLMLDLQRTHGREGFDPAGSSGSPLHDAERLRSPALGLTTRSDSSRLPQPYLAVSSQLSQIPSLDLKYSAKAPVHACTWSSQDSCEAFIQAFMIHTAPKINAVRVRASALPRKEVEVSICARGVSGCEGYSSFGSSERTCNRMLVCRSFCRRSLSLCGL